MSTDDLEIVGPQSFVFFVVAKLGDKYRQIAVAQRLTQDWQGFPECRGERLVCACLGLVDLFSSPDNRTAIEGELAMAEDMYNRQNTVPKRLELPDLNPRTWSSDIEFARFPSWNRSLHEFPFVSTCVALGLGCDMMERDYHKSTSMPLGTVYNDESLEYGMVVVDISDLARVRYGIVAFAATRERLSDGPPGEIELAMEFWTEHTLEPHRPRWPLSAVDYIDKFSYWTEIEPEVLNRLQQVPLIEVTALEPAWPLRTNEMDLNPVMPNTLGPRPLLEQSITILMAELLTKEHDPQILDEIRAMPGFQKTARSYLRLHSNRLHESPNAAYLLIVAFAGQDHLNWVLFRDVPAGVFRAALQSDQLKGAKTLSLCIDTVRGTSKELVEAISGASATLSKIYLHQSPTRENDDRSTELFAHLCPASNAILQRAKITLTGAFSSSLSHNIWLPTGPSFRPPFGVFPMQYMFARLNDNAASDLQHHARYYSLVDALLPPEQFATGFLRFMAICANQEAESDPFPFLSCAPGSMRTPLFGPVDGGKLADVTPLLGENSAIPQFPSRKPWRTAGRVECWPLIRSLAAGSWSVVLSRDAAQNPEPVSYSRRRRAYFSENSAFIRYAFIRVVSTVSASSAAESSLEVEVVGGLQEFLKQTAPNLDQAAVEDRLEELEVYIGRIGGQAPIAPTLEKKWVTVMDENEARGLLKDFLHDAATYGRYTLRLAMKERPQQRRWYPELLNEISEQSVSEFVQAGLPRPCRTFDWRGEETEYGYDSDEDNLPYED